MQTKRKAFGWQRRLWAMALAAVLSCIPMVGIASAAPATGAVIVPDKPAPKPTVSIVGNVVVDKNKPTGFYELSLRVKTPRIITEKGKPDKIVSEEDYAKVLEEDELKDTHKATEDYDIKNYPFESVAAAVYINLDALWPVTWGTGKPVYDTWEATDGTNGAVGRYKEYDYTDPAYIEAFPRGINLNDPDQPKIFTDLSGIIGGNATSVRLDTAHPDEMTNATALLEKVEGNGNAALLTLTASTTTTNNVVYNTETPVVVVRFAYDMNRFTKLEVGNPTADPPEPNNSDFWVGMDMSEGIQNGQFPLTFLAKGKNYNGYADSDAEVAKTSVHQSVWYSQNMIDDNANQESTHFYYYLGVEEPGALVPNPTVPTLQDTLSYRVVDDDDLTTMDLKVPKTEGRVVLAKKDTRPGYGLTNDPEPGEYSFFQNLLSMSKAEGTLAMKLVNAETYRKPTGSGGTTILFYDWDDSLIGSLVVDKGDVRAEVNEYVETNLIHPDLRASKLLSKGKVPEEGDANRTEYANLLDSLDRDYTYRGKYAYTVGAPDNVGPDGDTVNKARANGEDYPLTNKLDYVFYRRLNRIVERTDANNAKTSYYNTTSLLDANNADAALYPYVYGWAVVEDTSAKNKTGWKVMYDAAKTEDVWTTMGVGELSAVKPGVGRTNTNIPGNPKIEDVTEPAFIAYETAKLIKKGEEVAVPTQYQYTTADTAANKYFRFADFSDIDAELARYKKADGDNKDTLIVKAVYEPGPALMVDYNYQMVKEPYYSKLNLLSAADGGAYSVEISLERAITMDDVVYGVSRVRQPAIRQDTTVDQFWVENEDLGINHNLPGATQAIANTKTQTTYTNVNYDTGEVVGFQIILSARQQKVDYRLMETHNTNVVSGGQRSETNVEQQGTAYAVDNYNYFMEDSDSGDDYYDVTYEDREGSHGFVLYGTLDHMLQYATEYLNGSIRVNEFNSAVSSSIMADANLRADSNGAKAEYSNQAAMRAAVQNAAKDCKTNHYGELDYWNNDLGCAELNYHQLQWYIIDGVLYDRDTADSKLLKFCHLHAKCADLVSTKPKNWDELVAAGRDNPDYIDQLSLAEVEDMTHLRNSTGGSAFASVRVFKDRFSAAVKAGNTSWVDIQNAILRGSGDINTYWWFDGATSSSSPNSLTALGERAQAALVPQAYPDGSTATTRSKLESARATFNANATAGENKVATAWIRMTNNLVKDHQETEVGEGDDMEVIYTHTKFADFDEFLTAYLAALQKAAADDYVYGGDNPPTWEGLQRAILKPGEPYDNNPDPAIETDLADFWWKDGKTPLRVVNIKTLLEAARLSQSSDPDEKTQGEAALAKVTLEMLAGDPFYLRSSIKGAPLYDPEDPTVGYATIEDLLVKVKEAQTAGAMEWDTLQYYLIYDELLENTNDMLAETAYYWWKKGGTGTEINFPATFSTANTQSIVNSLMDIVIRQQFGDPKAANQLTDVFEQTHMIKRINTDPPTEKAHLDKFADVSEFLTEVQDFVQRARAVQGLTKEYERPIAYWWQMQHEILNDADWIAVGTPAYNNAKEEYWWYDKEDNIPEVDAKPEEPSDPLMGYIEEYLNSPATMTATKLKAKITIKNLSGTDTKENFYLLQDTSGAEWKSAKLTAAKNILVLMADDAKASPYYEDGKLTLYWAQMQYYFVTAYAADANGKKQGVLLSNEDALREIVNTWGWTKKSSGGANAFIPDEIDISGI